MVEENKSISEIWFGGDYTFWDRNSPTPNPAISKQWFVSPPGFDDMLRERF